MAPIMENLLFDSSAKEAASLCSCVVATSQNRTRRAGRGAP